MIGQNTMDSVAEDVKKYPFGLLSTGKESAVKVISTVGTFYKTAWYTALGSAVTLEENISDFRKKMTAKGQRVDLKEKSVLVRRLNHRKMKLVSVGEDIKSKAQDKIEDVEEILDRGVNRSLHFIGVPSRKDLDQMTLLMKDMADSISELSCQLQDRKSPAAAVRGKKTADGMEAKRPTGDS